MCTEGKHEVTEAKAQTSVMDMHNISQMLKVNEFCWPLKSVIVQYLEQVFLITEKDDQFSDKDEVKLLQQIIEIVLQDIEYQMSQDQDDDSMRRFIFPNGKVIPFYQAQNDYVYKSCVPVLLSFLKLKIEAAKSDELIEWIAKTCCQLYYRTEVTEYQKNVFQVINLIYNNRGYSHYLEDQTHPLSDGPANVEFGKGQVMNRLMTSFRENNEITKASVLTMRLNNLERNKRVHDIIQREFEKMIRWFNEIEQ